MELLRRQFDRLVEVRGAFQNRETRPELREWKFQNAAHGGGIDRNSGDAESAVEQDLGERPTKRMADNHRRAVELTDKCVVVVDNLLDPEVLDDGRISTQGINIVHSGPAAGDHLVTAIGVAGDPFLPTERGHEQAMNQDDRIRFCHPSLLTYEVSWYVPG